MLNLDKYLSVRAYHPQVEDITLKYLLQCYFILVLYRAVLHKAKKRKKAK